MMLSTISKNKDSYTQNNCLHAVRARQLQITLGQPSTKNFVRIITANTILNCPVTLADIKAAEFIFGPEVGLLKGKTTRQWPPQVLNNFSHVPGTILEQYQHITLCADVMFMNWIPMLITISRNLKFRTIEALKDRKSPAFIGAIKNVLQMYKSAGFLVQTALMD